MAARWVLHLDMDAFFASVEQLTRPTVRDRPVLVGGLGPRAVVAGASYQARVFGARSAMPMGQARRLCPHAVVLPPRFALYQALSEQVMGVLAAAAPVLEPVSLDEAFLEPPALAGAPVGDVEAFVARLRADVRAAAGLPASVGAGSGKQIAKIASDLAKPDGMRVVPPEEQEAVLAPLPVRSLWGVGPVAEAGLRRLGVQTVGELAALDLRDATDLLGTATGTELHRLARGIDERPVAPRGAAKQVSAETTFDADLTAMSDVHDAVARIARSAHRRLLASGRAARTVTVKVRGADFATATRSETARYPSTDLGALTATAQRLALAAVPDGGVRLIGVSLAGLVDDPPPVLFDDPAAVDAPEPAEGDGRGGAAAPTGPPGRGTGDRSSGPDVAAQPGWAQPTGALPTGAAAVGAAAVGAAAVGAAAVGAAVTEPAAAATAGPEAGGPAATGPSAATRSAAADPPAADDPRTDGPGPSPTGPDRTGGPGPWRAGDDVHHPAHGHGWVQGAGHGRVTVRFETRGTGPGRARTLAADDPALVRADPLASLA